MAETNEYAFHFKTTEKLGTFIKGELDEIWSYH